MSQGDRGQPKRVHRESYYHPRGNGLARGVFLIQGFLVQAEELLQRTFVALKTVYDFENVVTLQIVGTLVRTCVNQGRASDAEQLSSQET
jgi:hypothetical protein